MTDREPASPASVPEMVPSAYERQEAARKAALKQWDDEQHDKPWPMPPDGYLLEHALTTISDAYRDGWNAALAAQPPTLQEHAAAAKFLAEHLTLYTEGLVLALARAFAERVGAEREACVQLALSYRDKVDAKGFVDVDNPDHSLGQGYAANVIAKLMRRRAKS